jgi:ribosomal protein S8
MEYEKLQHVLYVLTKKGFIEDCPTKDYDSNISYWHFKKYPFWVKIAFHHMGFIVISYKLI